MSVTVNYGYKRLKIKLGPSSSLGEARDKACGMIGQDALSFGLCRSGKQLDLTVPFRLSNLVSNASVDLVPIQKPTKPVRIKLRIPGKPDFISAFAPETSIAQILLTAGLPTGNVRLGTQSLSPDDTLLHAGVTGAVVLVADTGHSSIPSAATSSQRDIPQSQTGKKELLDTKEEPNPPKKEDMKKTQEHTPEQSQPYESEAHKDRNVAIISKPHNEISSAEAPAEMTREQFMTYYEYLHAQATNQKPKKRQITKTTVRVKLPDGICIDATFKKEACGRDVYETVREHLRQSQDLFELIPRGRGDVLQPEQNLIDDCRYGDRILLIFRWLDRQHDTSEPMLSDKALQRLGEIRHPEPLEQGTTAPPKEQPPTPHTRTPGNSSTSIPKWLKLHK